RLELRLGPVKHLTTSRGRTMGGASKHTLRRCEPGHRITNRLRRPPPLQPVLDRFNASVFALPPVTAPSFAALRLA
ncbi:MAG: hypothetical protein AAFU55_14705, partial [Pseudomonadota bacterium]